MFPLLLLIPGGLLLWALSKKYAEPRDDQAASYFPPAPSFTRARQLPRPSPSSALTTADYLRHLHEATMAARVLDTVKSSAVAGDIHSLMQSPPDVARALEILSAPLSVMFAQKDLNVLGASPALPEDGVLGPATRTAIAGIQTRFGQSVTGALDAATAAAIRYAVGCINAQDRASAGV